MAAKHACMSTADIAFKKEMEMLTRLGEWTARKTDTNSGGTEMVKCKDVRAANRLVEPLESVTSPFSESVVSSMLTLRLLRDGILDRCKRASNVNGISRQWNRVRVWRSQTAIIMLD